MEMASLYHGSRKQYFGHLFQIFSTTMKPENVWEMQFEHKSNPISTPIYDI